MSVVYRLGTEADLEEIALVIDAGQKDWLHREGIESIRRRVFSQNREKTFFLAELDGTIIATAFYFPERRSLNPRPEAGDEDVHIGGIYLLPEHWGSGQGEEFMKHLLQKIRSEGFTHARLWSPVFARRARAFYEKSGWMPSERKMEYGGSERIEYLLPL